MKEKELLELPNYWNFRITIHEAPSVIIEIGGAEMIKFDSTGDIQADVRNLLVSNRKQSTFDHSQKAAKTNIKIAAQYGLDINVCELSGYLHDISAVISPQNMMSYAVDKGWYIDEAEYKYPFLLHQRISKVIACEDFGITDERILSAIEHHSTLKANPSAYDMALFVADKLAWDQCEIHGEAPFYSVVSEAIKHSLEAASLAYMDYIVGHKIILHPHVWFEEGLAFLTFRGVQR